MDLARALPEPHTAELLEEEPPPEARQPRQAIQVSPRLPSSKLLQDMPLHVGLSRLFTNSMDFLLKSRPQRSPGLFPVLGHRAARKPRHASQAEADGGHGRGHAPEVHLLVLGRLLALLALALGGIMPSSAGSAQDPSSSSG